MTLRSILRGKREAPDRDAETALSEAFDSAFYLAQNPDLSEEALGGLTPLQHYVRLGWREGRDPAPSFSTRFYLHENTDVRESGIDPFVHYLTVGRTEGRPPNAEEALRRTEAYRRIGDELDPDHYRRTAGLEEGADPVLHYMQEGWREGRDPSPVFSTAFYLAQNPDVRDLGSNPFFHYLEIGRAEGRYPTLAEQLRCSPAYGLIAAELDADHYRRTAGLDEAADPVLHYMQTGWREGRDPSPAFSTAFYLAQNADVRDLGTNPFLHYLEIGRAEGRHPTMADQLRSSSAYRLIAAELDPDHYRRAAGLDPEADPVLHYMQTGWREGRDPSPAFSTRFYLDQNPDVGERGVNPFLHYLEIGRAEGRPSTPAEQIRRSESYALMAAAFDELFYRRQAPALPEGEDPLLHYMQTGWSEGRDPSAAFSTRFYLEGNPDVAKSGTNPFLHYLRTGRDEGRAPAPPRHMLDPEMVRLVAREFDAGFYRETNPDLAEHSDPLVHFLETGWREGRDPSPAFSTRYYLAANPDVARSRINPFHHYLRQGRGEGRDSRPSSVARSRPAGPEPLSARTVAPRLAVLALIRNEIETVPAFLAHLRALFDEVVLVDRDSCDGTLEALEAAAEVEASLYVYRLAGPGGHDALAVNHLLRTAPELSAADWVFLLEAGDFLPFEERSALDAALALRRSDPVIAMHRQTAIPERYAEAALSLDADARLFLSKTPSPVVRVAFQPARLPQGAWVSSNGVLAMEHGLALDTVPAGFPLIHLPVRSRSQFRRDLSRLEVGQRGSRIDPARWDRLRRIFSGEEIPDDLLNAVAAGDGVDDSDLAPLGHDALRARGFDLARAGIAQHPIPLPEPAIHPAERSRERGTEEGGDAAPVTRLVTEGRVLRRGPDDRGHSYDPLAAEAADDRPPVSDSRFLADFLKPSYWPIDTLTTSAWSGHIPFLFSLVALERPRRAVELGTHFGASFLALCQVIERLDLPCRPIAVDTWTGDPHAGHYDESVFQTFIFHLERYRDFAGYLRMLFSEAAPRFAPGSIDLLHIDGLHTYEAVRSDYETWLPKMSDRGVILFHDTNEHGRGFGVWRLWEEIRDRHPTFELRHSHGLGIACVGSRETGLSRLIRMTRTDPALGVLLQQHFEALGQTSPELAARRSEPARREEQRRAFEAMGEELTRTREALEAAEAELRSLPAPERGT